MSETTERQPSNDGRGARDLRGLLSSAWILLVLAGIVCWSWLIRVAPDPPPSIPRAEAARSVPATGLGLATCHGIVKQNGGHIWLYSEPGHGTTVKIYLPRVAEAVEARVGRIERAAPSGVETILLVEDDPLVRGVAADALRSHGYRVLEAATGLEALRRSRESDKPIDLVLTDVVMPGMSGPELAKRLVAEYPTVKVLFVSGYAGNTIVSNGTLLANNATGSATGSGSLSVLTGATLGGTGIISGTVTLNGSDKENQFASSKSSDGFRLPPKTCASR